jgi:hypothetical protein
MTSTRRPATAADLTIGARCYKGNGATVYRVVAVVPEGGQHPNMGPIWTGFGAQIVKVDTKRVPAYGVFLRPSELTVDA